MAQQPRHGGYGGHRVGGGAPGGGPRRDEATSREPSAEFKALLEGISLAQPAADLFDAVAEKIARTLRPSASHGPNKRTQVRRFYDEMLRFRMRLPEARAPDGPDEDFARALPFLRMLNARAAYAAERKGEGGTLVTTEFTAFLRRLLDQVSDRRTLANACTMFEAVIGFLPPDKG
ncbi:MAG: type III-A CRISPR-associated protein Csm2 [Sphingomonadaceae bacterium]